MKYNKFYSLVMRKGERLFENKIKFNIWMSEFSKSLGDKPVNFITSYDGLELVFDELNKIEKNLKK